MTTNQVPQSDAVTQTTDSTNWISLKPSRANLTLTLLAWLLALVAIWLLPFSVWLRGAGMVLAGIVLLIEIVHIRMLGADAIGDFALITGEVPRAGKDGATASVTTLMVRLRYANPARRAVKAPTVVEGVVCGSPFVSTYFSTIPYRLPGDAAWRRFLPRILPLWADSLDHEAFRRVRVQLKWQRSESAAKSRGQLPTLPSV
jgi:hypothetical protein